jgi:hypothetical protein
MRVSHCSVLAVSLALPVLSRLISPSWRLRSEALTVAPGGRGFFHLWLAMSLHSDFYLMPIPSEGRLIASGVRLALWKTIADLAEPGVGFPLEEERHR